MWSSWTKKRIPCAVTAAVRGVTISSRNLRKIAIRKATLWNQGLIEGAWLIRINSARPPGQRISAAVDMDAKGTTFFRALLDELYLREPTIRSGKPT